MTQSEAYEKGWDDYESCGGQADLNLIVEFVHPNYDPPSGYEMAYRKGWKDAARDDWDPPDDDD